MWRHFSRPKLAVFSSDRHQKRQLLHLTFSPCPERSVRPASVPSQAIGGAIVWPVNRLSGGCRLSETPVRAFSTHKQALSALLVFYGKVLGVHLPWMAEIGRPRTQLGSPVLLSKDEIAEIS